MKLIGITGGIGAGKSEVMAYLAGTCGAKEIYLDEISRTLLMPDGACYGRVLSFFGTDILKKDGTLDRGEIARIVMGSEESRQKLDAVVHPAVRAEALRKIAAFRQEGAALAVMEGALLIEAHYDEICDELWYIYAGEKTRRERLLSSRGYDEERIMNTFKRQLKEDEFRAHADFVLDNDGDFADTKRQIDERLGR